MVILRGLLHNSLIKAQSLLIFLFIMSKTEPSQSQKRFSITITRSDEQVDEKLVDVNHHNINSLSVPDRHSEKSDHHFPKCKILSEQIVNMLNSKDQAKTSRNGLSRLHIIHDHVSDQSNGSKDALSRDSKRNRKRFCSNFCELL
jgi:hypothetical protein